MKKQENRKSNPVIEAIMFFAKFICILIGAGWLLLNAIIPAIAWTFTLNSRIEAIEQIAHYHGPVTVCSYTTTSTTSVAVAVEKSTCRTEESGPVYSLR